MKTRGETIQVKNKPSKYKGYITQTQLAKFTIESNAPKTKGDILSELIMTDMISDVKKWMVDGDRYYRVEHDIKDVDFTSYEDSHGVKQKRKNKANNHVTHPFHRRQVIEKVSYLLNKEITIQYDSENDTEKKKNIELFNSIVGKKFQKILIDLATNASNKGIEWLHVFIKARDENNNSDRLGFQIVDAIEVIPIWDSKQKNELAGLIRYFNVEFDIAGKKKIRIKAEWWDKQTVEVWMQNENGDFEIIEPKHKHITATTTVDGKTTGLSWGMVPFIPLPNNTEYLSDLKPIKDMIDNYDKIVSKNANNLEDIQEAIWKIIGFGGDTPDAILDKLLKFKIIQIPSDENADISSETLQIPYEASSVHLKNLDENIHTHGMSLDPKVDKFGDNPSGVALKWLYLPLDLKASMLEVNFKFMLSELLLFIKKFLSFKNEKFDDTKFSFIFNKTMITNVKEQVDIALENKGLTSDQTMLENHPFIKDAQQELELIDQERAKNPVIPL